MASKIKLDHAGIRTVLSSPETSAAVHALAERVAANVQHTTRSGAEVTADVKDFRTDRAIAVVALKGPSAPAVEAKYGVLARAAADAGVQVSAR